MKNIIYTLQLAMLICATGNLYGQLKAIDEPVDSAKMYKIELKNGAVVIGNILQKDSMYVLMKTSSTPEIEIPVLKIKSILEVDKSKLKKSDYWFLNPSAKRYFFGLSAFPLQKGEGYYQNTYIIVNSFNVGITNNITVGGGLSVFNFIGDSFESILFITPKVGFEVAKEFHAGFGVSYATTPGVSSGRSNLGIIYGMGTYGNLNHNLTGGLGWGFLEGEFSGEPIVTFSGMTRMSKNVALVTENWFFTTTNGDIVYSYGIRFFGKKITFDLAIIRNYIPYVDFVLKF